MSYINFISKRRAFIIAVLIAGSVLIGQINSAEAMFSTKNFSGVQPSGSTGANGDAPEEPYGFYQAYSMNLNYTVTAGPGGGKIDYVIYCIYGSYTSNQQCAYYDEGQKFKQGTYDRSFNLSIPNSVGDFYTAYDSFLVNSNKSGVAISWSVGLNSRIVSIDSFYAPPSVNAGNSFTISWDPTNMLAVGGIMFETTGPISCPSGYFFPPLSSASCTATGVGTATVKLNASGAGLPNRGVNGPIPVSKQETIIVKDAHLECLNNTCTEISGSGSNQSGCSVAGAACGGSGRYKCTGSGSSCAWDPNDSGPNQCSPPNDSVCIGSTPPPPGGTCGGTMTANSAIRGSPCDFGSAPVATIAPSATSCLTYCYNNGGTACEFFNPTGECYVMHGSGCFVEGGFKNWYAAAPVVNPVACPVYGCTNSAADNYNPSATIDNGTCTFSCSGSSTQGCISDANACNQTASGTQTRTCNSSNGTWSGWSSCSATIPPNTCDSTATISASPNPIIYGTASTLTWSSTNTVANSCSITGGQVVGGSTNLPTSGSRSTTNLTADTTYTVTCTGFNDSPISNSVTVSVGGAPAMNYFRCNGVNTNGTCYIDYGGTAAITWSSSNTTNCSLVSTVPTDEGVGPSGTNNYAGIIANRDYSIECWNNESGVHAPALPLPLHVVINSPDVDIKANNSNGPITLAWNTSANLSWTSTSAASCNASGDWSGAKALNSSESTGNLTNPKTYNYTLACSGNGSDSDTVQVILNPPVPNSPSNVVTTAPDYCLSGPAATITWTYSDPSGSPQSAYEVQMDEQGSFQDPEYQTGKVLFDSNSNFTGPGILQFNKNYKTRVRVWNNYDVVSGWTTEPGNYDTPPYAYPQVDFYWTVNGIQNNPSPPLNKPVAFTDQTVFNGNPNGREWDWLFGDGGSSTIQNPSHTYSAEGSYYVTLTATDNANQFCSRTKGPLIIQKPIPRWREIAPR